MSSDWADFERKFIKRSSQNRQPTAFQEWSLLFLTSLMQGSPNQGRVVTDEIAHQMLKSGQAPRDAWYDFSNLIFSAAYYTSSHSSHERLVGLVFTLANHVGTQTTADPSQDGASAARAEVDSLFKNLTELGWIARDLWNGPKGFADLYGNAETGQRLWVNLNRFMAHLSCQQRRTPVEPLHEWVEDFGLWNITDGLEDKAGIQENGEAAALWLIIAGPDIYNDRAWGKRDGNTSPGIHLRQGRLWSSRLEDGATQEMRWAFWKERLLELASDEYLDVSTRETAKQAEQAMGEIQAGRSMSAE